MNKICINCNIEKDISEYTKHKKYKGGHIKMCKMCEKSYIKEHSYVNKEYKKEYNKKYNIEKKDILKEYHRKYNSNKYKTDMLYKLKKNIRILIYKAFKNNGYKKNSKTFNVLGCTYEFFLEYVISQFEPWMTLENNGIYTGNYNETWQLDHIQPISNATSEEDIIKLSHYTNLRPLCSRKNLEKSNK